MFYRDQPIDWAGGGVKVMSAGKLVYWLSHGGDQIQRFRHHVRSVVFDEFDAQGTVFSNQVRDFCSRYGIRRLMLSGTGYGAPSSATQRGWGIVKRRSLRPSLHQYRPSLIALSKGVSEGC